MRPNFPACFSVLASAALLCGGALQSAGQTSPPAPQQGPGSGDCTSDKFCGMSESSTRLRSLFEKLDSESNTEIDSLLRSNRCQAKRVEGLLDRVSEALDLWVQAESKYWAAWGAAEEERVDAQRKSLASMEAEQRRAEDLLATVTKDRESLMRDKATLEKYPNQTQEIRARIDTIVQDVKESETRLQEAQKNYDDISIKVRNMNVSINARLVDIRQNQRRVEAYALDLKSGYAAVRAAANEICNKGTPSAGKSSLPDARKKAGAK